MTDCCCATQSRPASCGLASAALAARQRHGGCNTRRACHCWLSASKRRDQAAVGVQTSLASELNPSSKTLSYKPGAGLKPFTPARAAATDHSGRYTAQAAACHGMCETAQAAAAFQQSLWLIAANQQGAQRCGQAAAEVAVLTSSRLCLCHRCTPSCRGAFAPRHQPSLLAAAAIHHASPSCSE